MKASNTQRVTKPVPTDKDHLTVVTDPDEIEAVSRELATGDLSLPIGGFIGETCVAHTWSLQRYRERRRDGRD